MRTDGATSHSELQCWRRCPREHQYRYVQLRRTRLDAAPLTFGRLIHELLEGAARGVTKLSGKPDPYDLAKASAMMAGYAARWPASLEMLEVENLYRTERGGFVYTGKMDGIVRYQCRVMLKEYKTTDEVITPGSDYWAVVAAADSQVSQYMVALRGTPYETDSCLYTVLKKPGLRPLRKNKRNAADETPDEYYRRCVAEIATDPEGYYQRQVVVRLSSELDAAEEDMMQQREFMAFAAAKGWAPKHTASCRRWGRLCEYFPVCSGQTGIDNDLKYRTAATPHEELST